MISTPAMLLQLALRGNPEKHINFLVIAYATFSLLQPGFILARCDLFGFLLRLALSKARSTPAMANSLPSSGLTPPAGKHHISGPASSVSPHSAYNHKRKGRNTRSERRSVTGLLFAGFVANSTHRYTTRPQFYLRFPILFGRLTVRPLSASLECDFLTLADLGYFLPRFASQRAIMDDSPPGHL